MTDPSEHLGQIIDQHREHERNGGSGCCCGCGAEGLPDHSRHVAQAIVDRLGLTRESADDLSGKIPLRKRMV